MFQEAGAYEPQASVCKKGGPLTARLPSPLLLASLLLSPGREVDWQDGSVLLKTEHKQNLAHHHSVQFAYRLMGWDL